MKQRLIFVAGFVVFFAAGLYIGEMRANRNSSEPNTAPNSVSNNESPLSSEKQSLSISVTDTSQSPSSFESQSSRRVTMDLLQAWGKPKPERTAELLSALEEVTTVPLTKELLAVMRQILDGREIDEVDYLLSVLEQREEKASVAFLADALDHPQQDIRDRALMACEAVAGTIFFRFRCRENLGPIVGAESCRHGAFFGQASGSRNEHNFTNSSRTGRDGFAQPS